MHALKNVETSGTRLTTPASLLPSASFPVLSLSFIILTQVHALRQPGESSLCETGNWTCALLLGYSDVPSGYSAHEPPTIPCEAANATYLKGSICALTFGMFHAVDLSSLVEFVVKISKIEWNELTVRFCVFGLDVARLRGEGRRCTSSLPLSPLSLFFSLLQKFHTTTNSE
ncbi:uncharacterized protein LOC125516703 isoform X1 [Triticum urartu]|uniref:uncharacterized protein LOC125516703 isoform X1 n=1 Tax=Triticum urartu TaxID=4572 RepID=UPI002042BF23|nr:uncharacterized protein LOC125516703 isoform X1 [Triticum urartu]